MISPFVGLTDGRPAVHAESREVDRVFDVALSELLADGVYREERWAWGLDGTERAMQFYELEDETVWGATARILTGFLAQVLDLDRRGRLGRLDPGLAGAGPPDNLGTSPLREVPGWKSRSGSASRVGGRTGSTTSPSCPAAARATPRTSTSPGRSTRSSSSSRSSRRRWTASCRRRPRSRSAASAASAASTSRACGPATRTPTSVFDEIAELPTEKATRRMQEIYQEPIKDELIGRRIREIKDAGVTACASLTPQRVEQYAQARARGRARHARDPGHRRVGRARVEGPVASRST